LLGSLVGNGSAVATEFRDCFASAANGDVVHAAAAVANSLGGGGFQQVPLADGTDEGDLRACCDGGGPVTVAGAGERRVGEQEDVAAVGDAVPVDHGLGDAHPSPGEAVGRFHQFDAECSGSAVVVEHRVCRVRRCLCVHQCHRLGLND